MSPAPVPSDDLKDLPGEDTRQKYDLALATMYDAVTEFLARTPIKNMDLPQVALRSAHHRFERVLAVALYEQEQAVAE